MGETPYDDKKSARNHIITGEYFMQTLECPYSVGDAAVLTMGEGYHNFHHQFPMDYRNAIKWYQFDPTKWFIATCAALRVASQLRVFPPNEVNKAELAMKLKELQKTQDDIRWPAQVEDLPIVSWESCKSRILIPLADTDSRLRYDLYVQFKRKQRTAHFSLCRDSSMMSEPSSTCIREVGPFSLPKLARMPRLHFAEEFTSIRMRRTTYVVPMLYQSCTL